VSKRTLDVGVRLVCGVALLLFPCCSSNDAQPDAAAGGAGGATVASLQLPGDKFYPESLNATSDGTVYVGSIATGAVVKFEPGQTVPTTFLPPGDALAGVAGVLVDEASHSLFLCAVDASFQTTPSVRRFDLSSGALLATYSFPGAPRDTDPPKPTLGFPNDLAFDAAHHLFVTESFGGAVYRVSDLEKSSTMSLWATDPGLAPVHMGAFGANGISWDGSGFYVNNNDSGAVVRIAMNADGSAGAITPLTIQPALQHPDGQRQLDPHTLLVVDNAGTLSKLVIAQNDDARTTVIRMGLDAPTSVVVVGGAYWVTEGQLTSSLLTGMPPNLPFMLRSVEAN